METAATTVDDGDERVERRRRRAIAVLAAGYGRWERASGPAKLTTALVATYVVVFASLTWAQQSHFATFGFDMGIYDQGLWLLSRFREPFVTVRGLNYFGHHANVLTLAFVPFYWLGAGPHFLYLVETVWLAAGGIPLYLLARERLREPWLAPAIVAAYLLYPSLEWINWWHFHPDALIITPLLFAWLFATRRSWRGFWVAVAIALLAKEDAALAVVVLGIVVALRYSRRTGVITAGIGAAWFVLATKIIIPTANGGLAPLYADLFPGYGNSVFEIAWNMVRHPSRLWHSAWATGPGSPRTYYWKLLAPVAFVPLLALPVLAIGGPQTLINVVSGHSPTHDIRYHYSSIVIAAVFLATVEGIRLLRRTELQSFAVGALLVAAVASNMLWSPSPLGAAFDTGIWAREPGPRQAAMEEAVSLVEPSDGVTATYQIVPHLTHRTYIYEWPNPWVIANWGVPGSKPPKRDAVDTIVVDRAVLGDQASLFDSLTASEFRIIYERDGIVVARRR